MAIFFAFIQLPSGTPRRFLHTLYTPTGLGKFLRRAKCTSREELFSVVADTVPDYIDKPIPVPGDLFRARAVN
jgi:hypothetical protein